MRWGVTGNAGVRDHDVEAFEGLQSVADPGVELVFMSNVDDSRERAPTLLADECCCLFEVGAGGERVLDARDLPVDVADQDVGSFAGKRHCVCSPHASAGARDGGDLSL